MLSDPSPIRLLSMPAFVPFPPLGCPQGMRKPSSTTSSLVSFQSLTVSAFESATNECTTSVAPQKIATPAPTLHPSPRIFPHAAACGDNVAIVWLRDDLRVHDHAALHLASESGLQIAPLFIMPDALQDDFTRAALAQLRVALRSLGTTLYVRHGKVADAVLSFSRETGASVVYTTRGVRMIAQKEERAVETALNATGTRLEKRWSGFVRDPDSLPFPPADTPGDCDAYAMKVRNVKVKEALPAPRALRGMQIGIDQGDIPEVGDKERDAGEAGAWRRVCEYIVGAGVATVGGKGRCVDTKFGQLGPFLRLGCVSPRAVYHEVVRKVPKMSVKFYCAELELLLGDFFKMCILKERAQAVRCSR